MTNDFLLPDEIFIRRVGYHRTYYSAMFSKYMVHHNYHGYHINTVICPVKRIYLIKFLRANNSVTKGRWHPTVLTAIEPDTKERLLLCKTNKEDTFLLIPKSLKEDKVVRKVMNIHNGIIEKTIKNEMNKGWLDESCFIRANQYQVYVSSALKKFMVENSYHNFRLIEKIKHYDIFYIKMIKTNKMEDFTEFNKSNTFMKPDGYIMDINERLYLRPVGNDEFLLVPWSMKNKDLLFYGGYVRLCNRCTRYLVQDESCCEGMCSDCYSDNYNN